MSHHVPSDSDRPYLQTTPETPVPAGEIAEAQWQALDILHNTRQGDKFDTWTVIEHTDTGVILREGSESERSTHLFIDDLKEDGVLLRHVGAEALEAGTIITDRIALLTNSNFGSKSMHATGVVQERYGKKITQVAHTPTEILTFLNGETGTISPRSFAWWKNGLQQVLEDMQKTPSQHPAGSTLARYQWRLFRKHVETPVA